MSEPYVGEIKIFAGNFAPRGWAFCDGQLLAVSQNDALFSLLGTIYGGDGETTFGLPDIRGRVPIHHGSGPGLSARPIGSKGGAEAVTLIAPQLPAHTHKAKAAVGSATTGSPANALPASAQGDLYTGDFAASNMSASAITTSGSSQSHSNLQPFLCVNFIIALFGIYPSGN